MKKEKLSATIKKLMLLYPEKQFDVEIMWEFLQDLTDKEFDEGVENLIKKTERIDAGTNIIAIIRQSKHKLPVWRTTW